MLGLGLELGAAWTSPLMRYSIGDEAPAIIADFRAGVYGLQRSAVTFDTLFGFSRLSDAWRMDALGHWSKVQTDEPRTGHHIWKQGQLVPAGIALCSDQLSNVVRHSDALDNGLWVQGNDVTVSPQGAIAGSPAFELGDQSALYGNLTQNLGVLGTGEWCLQVKVAKNPTATTSFAIRFTWPRDGGTAVTGISFNPVTGVMKSGWTGNGALITRHVEDRGDHWFAWVSVDTTSATGNATVQIFPAHDDLNGVAGGNNIGVHKCAAIQVNPGRYPGNYTPTEISDVFVAAESLQIDPVTMVKAVAVFGPELADISNHTDTSDPGGFITAIDDVLTVTSDTGTAKSANVFPLAQGETYLLSYIGEGQNLSIYESETSVIGTTQLGSNSMIFTAGEFAEGLGFWNVVTGTSGSVSSLSVRKITMPKEMTVLMEGMITYADASLDPQAIFTRYRENDSNHIVSQLKTSGTDTGKVQFQCTSDGIQSQAVSSADAYSPGLDTQYSVAFVISETEIEGFCNGVSTGKTSFGGMPALLEMPFELFPLGNGSITAFRLWPEALPSTVLLQATL